MSRKIKAGRLASRQVQVGLRNWQHVEVLSGLVQGEQVVISLDRAEVEDGALVEVSVETES